ERNFAVPVSSFIVPGLIFLILLIASLCAGFRRPDRKPTPVAPTPITITCVPAPSGNTTAPPVKGDRSAPAAKLP
ncbi:MAG TPA: hypothetical protein VHX14_24855, partial [Thermoanaerobaculia bacterium]|nr:hypothetical protein [Thermoanaerobaculia bacterium]